MREKILYCVAGRSGFDATKREAGDIARALDCDLVVYHAGFRPWTLLERIAGSTGHEAHELRGVEGDAALDGCHAALEAEETRESLVEAIVDAAERHAVRMILVPTHGRSGLAHLVQGSVAELVVRESDREVMTLRLDAEKPAAVAGPFDRVVLATDLAERTPQALRHARDLAARFGCGSTLLHVVESFALAAYPMGGVVDVVGIENRMEETARELMSRWVAAVGGAEGPDRTEIAIEKGPVLSAIRDHLERHERPLLVVPSEGRDSVEDSLIGSHAERALRIANGSVLVIPKGSLEF
ncbi:MAG: universal stress protein [Planctomycetota bacterium]